MELKHYTLSQLIVTHARPSKKIILEVKHDGCGIAEVVIEEGMTVAQAAYKLSYMIPPSQEESVGQRLYKMRFKDVSAFFSVGGEPSYVFDAIIGGRSMRQTRARVRVFDEAVQVSNVTAEEPCMGLDLSSPKDPVQEITPCVGVDLGVSAEPERITPVELADLITQDPAIEVVEVGQPREAANDPVKPAPTLKESLLTWWRKILS